MEPEELAASIKRLVGWAEQHAPKPEPPVRVRLRIDQAVELPLPDADGRRRLVALYGEGLGLSLRGDAPLIEELDGTSPAFIRELLRRGALLAAEESADGPLRVSEQHLKTALDELRRGGDELTQTLLGARALEPVDGLEDVGE